MKWVKTLVLIIVTLASASVLVVAVSAALSMAALCLIALLTAYVVSPEDVKAVYQALSGKIDAWLKTLSDTTQAMAGAIREAAAFAREASQRTAAPEASPSQEETDTTRARPKRGAKASSKTMKKAKDATRPS